MTNFASPNFSGTNSGLSISLSPLGLVELSDMEFE